MDLNQAHTAVLQKVRHINIYLLIVCSSLPIILLQPRSVALDQNAKVLFFSSMTPMPFPRPTHAPKTHPVTTLFPSFTNLIQLGNWLYVLPTTAFRVESMLRNPSRRWLDTLGDSPLKKNFNAEKIKLCMSYVDCCMSFFCLYWPSPNKIIPEISLKNYPNFRLLGSGHTPGS